MSRPAVPPPVRPADPGPDLLAHVEEAVRISRAHVARGGIPFAGIVVRDGRVLGTGVNRVREDRDPTAHAEVVALRDAAANAGLAGTAGSTLVASGEPCALCYLAARYAGVEHVVYAADRRTAAAYGFDYSGTYAVFATDPTGPTGPAGPADPAGWPVKVTHVPVDGHELPFREFLTAQRGALR
jgi:tRNA(Arg) A34 adenosine deaminase TadA